MLKSYLLIALRSLKRDIGFSLINIVGLAIGMAAAILILFWVIDEVNYDRFHSNIDEIYRVYEYQTYSGTDDLLVYNTPGPLAPELRNSYSSIKKVARFTPIWQRNIFTVNSKDSYVNNGYFADKEAFDLFTFKFIYGSPETSLSDPNSIILTQKFAERFFGDENPVGKNIVINSEFSYNVTGVVQRPSNTHLKFDYVISFEGNIDRYWGEMNINWTNNSFYTYVQIDESVDFKQVEEQISNVVANNGQENVTLHLEPLMRSYLYNIWGSGAITNVRIFSAIAFLVLLIACINFMNLATARSAKRAKEVGLRKVAGGKRIQLIGQFLGESILLTLIAFVIAMMLVAIFLPSFNDLSGKNIAFSSTSSWMFGVVVLVAIVTGVISGSYPAFFLSSFVPIKVLKGEFSKGSKLFRTVLVVFQFSLSVALIVATILVSRQLDYMMNKNLGFQKENIVSVMFNKGGLEKYDMLKEELLKIPSVESVTCSNALPYQVGNSTGGVSWEGQDPNDNSLFSTLIAHNDFLDVFGMELVKGSAWNPKMASDSMGLVINQEAARVMGMDNPVGKPVELWGYSFEIIGVVADFNFKSLKHKVQPLLIFTAAPYQNRVSLRIHSEDITSTVKEIEKVWGTVYPGELFTYQFFDELFDSLYRSEMRMTKLFSYFSFLAILISCLGLLGLATFMAEQKFREIAIRKTLGATELTIVILMVWEFVKWVLLANVLGWILAYYTMEYWLREYAYRISTSFDVFLFAGLISLAIALITVGYKAIKASHTNPVEALKYE
ncbi:MAG: ABC transporter permease [Bacteroidales bacterium]